MSYNPNAKTAQILDRAYDILASVPYKVSARWLFYRLLQEGFYSGKDDYKNKFLPAVSMARHEEYGQWMPDSLVDETREIIDRGNGFSSPEAWMKAVSIQLSCSLSKWDAQPEYIDKSLFAKIEMEEAEVTAWFRERFLGMADEWRNS